MLRRQNTPLRTIPLYEDEHNQPFVPPTRKEVPVIEKHAELKLRDTFHHVCGQPIAARLSSAISIGCSGGPFGAKGPIIMTGGAFGSLIAQFFHVTSVERRTLLVAGAAAGMSAAFAAPLAALLLSVELLQGWITQAAGNSFSRRSSFRQN